MTMAKSGFNGWGKVTLGGIIALLAGAIAIASLRERDVAAIETNRSTIVQVQEQIRDIDREVRRTRLLLERVAVRLDVDTELE